MQISTDNPLMALLDQWASQFGWYDSKIDLQDDAFRSFTTPDCTLTAHAPVWGTKEGSEEAVPIVDIRKQLSRLLRFGRPIRNEMHMAFHPAGNAVCVFAHVQARIVFIPITLRRESVLFVLDATETANGLRISRVNEWSAADPDAASLILVNHHGWPTGTTLEPHVAFGAAS